MMLTVFYRINIVSFKKMQICLDYVIQNLFPTVDS